MVRLGHTMSAAAGKRASLDTWPRLQKDQASSIAITTVLPLPVAIFRPRRVNARQARVRRQIAQPIQVIVGELGREARPPAGQPDFVEEDDRLGGFQLAEEEPPRPVGPPPVAQQLLGDLRRALVAGRAPAAHILAQGVDQRQILALLLGQQRQLPFGDALGFVPVRGRPPARHADGIPLGRVDPVLGRLGVGRTEDRLLDRLDGKGLLIGGRIGWSAHRYSFAWKCISRPHRLITAPVGQVGNPCLEYR